MRLPVTNPDDATSIDEAEAIAMIPDGAIIMFGGFLGCGSAHHIIDALSKSGKKDFTIIGNDCGMATGPNGDLYGMAKLVHNHQVKRVIATHVGMTPDVGTQGMVDKTLQVDLIPQGTLAEMIRAGGAGLGLALCQRIAELHGTALEYESEPGVGTTVRVLLKGGTFAAMALTALVFAVCLIVPALMLDGGEEPGATTQAPTPASDLSAAERASLYERCESGELERTHLVGELDSGVTMAAMKRIGALENALVCDRGAVQSVASTGAYFYAISDGVNSIRILEYYREWTGDWSNWFIAVLDVDSLDLLYCYYSASCVQNLGNYSDGRIYEIGGLIGSIGTALDMDEYEVWDAVEDSVPFELKLKNSVSGETRDYSVQIHAYEDAASLLLDIKLRLEG